MSDPYTSYLDSLDGNGELALVNRWKLGDANLDASPDTIPDSVGSEAGAAASDGTLSLADAIFANGPASLQTNGSTRIDIPGSTTIGVNDFTFAVQIAIPEISSFAGIISTGTNAGAGEITPLSATGAGALATFWNGSAIVWSDSVIDDSQSHYLVLTGDRDGNLTLYIDGEGVDTSDISALSATSISWGAVANRRFYDRNNVRLPSGSRLSDIQFWTGAMSAEQVIGLYDSLLATPSGRSRSRTRHRGR